MCAMEEVVEQEIQRNTFTFYLEADDSYDIERKTSPHSIVEWNRRKKTASLEYKTLINYDDCLLFGFSIQ